MVSIPRVTGTSLCVQNAFIKFIIDFKGCIGAKYLHSYASLSVFKITLTNKDFSQRI